VLFLVNRGNLARQTKKEFDAYASPHNTYKFGEEFIVQHLQNNQIDKSTRVVIRTLREEQPRISISSDGQLWVCCKLQTTDPTHRPVQRGFRFSANASGPSMAS
jgi:type I site-specific restriction endonuclease